MGGQVRAYVRGKTRFVLTPSLMGVNVCVVLCVSHAELDQSKAELAVHKRKVEGVRRWLIEAFEGGPSAKLRKYRVRVCPYEPLKLIVSAVSCS